MNDRNESAWTCRTKASALVELDRNKSFAELDLDMSGLDVALHA